MNLESGEWEGEYIDVRGYRGELQLKIETDGDTVRGAYELAVPDEHETAHYEGELRGHVEKDHVQLELPGLGPDREPIETTATIESALPYARQALVGRMDSVPEQNFGGGPWIAWRFERVRVGGEE